MQSVFVIITKLIASKKYFCKEVFCNNFGRDGTQIFPKHWCYVDFVCNINKLAGWMLLCNFCSSSKDQSELV